MTDRSIAGRLEFVKGGGRPYPARHEVVDAFLLEGGERIPVVVKKTRTDLRQRLKGTKAGRSFAAARRLLELGLPTPEPLGVATFPEESWYVARKLPGAAQIREWFLRREDSARPEPSHPIPFEEMVRSAAALARRLHDSGVFFRDFTDGNLLVTAGGGLWLVDLNRARFSESPVGALRRLRDLARLGLNRVEDRRLLLVAYFEPDPPPAWALTGVSLLRGRIVLWDELKLLLRPWRRRKAEKRYP